MAIGAEGGSVSVRSVRLFLSSPTDVEPERRRLAHVAERISAELLGLARIEIAGRDPSSYAADANVASEPPAAADCNIVVAMFWTTLGERAPELPGMPDGEPYPSTVAYEVISALAVRQSEGSPDIWVFHKTERPRVAIDDAAELERVRSQWAELQTFFERWFPSSEDGPQVHNFVTGDEFERAVEELLRNWIGQHVLAGRSTAWPIAIKGSPFCGLAPFDPEHAPVFFGRARDAGRAVERLKAVAERGTPFLLIVGESGVGKSSLLQAALVPRLTAPGVVTGVESWRVALVRPGPRPIEALAAALLSGGAIEGEAAALPELAEGTCKSVSELAALLRRGDAAAVKPILDALERARGAALLLAVDPLDDLFAADLSAADRVAFPRLLRSLVASGRVWVLATLRTALYVQFVADDDLRALKDAGADHDLAPLAAAELAEIVRAPAQAAGLVYETNADGERLDERLLRDAARANSLPLLQFTLQQLFAAREIVGVERRLTFAAYAALGDVAGALDQAAEGALAAPADAAIRALPALLSRLAAPLQD